MLSALSCTRQALLARVSGTTKPKSRSVTPATLRQPISNQHSLVKSRQYHASRKLFQIPSKPTGGVVSDGLAGSASHTSEKADLNVSGYKTPSGEVSDSPNTPVKSGAEQKGDVESPNQASVAEGSPVEEETGAGELRSLTAVPAPFASQVSSMNRRSGRKRGSGRTARPSSAKGYSSFFEIGGYTPEEMEALLHLRVHIHGLLSSFCTNPRNVSLANFPSISPLEQQQVAKAIDTLMDEQITRVLELEAFSHLTSTPMSSLMTKGRTAMFNQIGFTLKAPADHESYVLHSIQRLAEKYRANVIDFDFTLLRQSQSFFTESLLQAGTSEENNINLNELFSELVREDNDFSLFVEILFEVIQKHVSAARPPHPQQLIDCPPQVSSETGDSADKGTPSFVVVLRGLDRLRSFPYRQFKELLRACRAHVLFLEVDLANSQGAGGIQPIGFISPSSMPFMISPNMIGDEDEGDASLPAPLKSILERLTSPSSARKSTASTGYFLNTDPIIMTNRAILEAESRKAEEMRQNAESGGGARGLGGFLARLSAEPSPTSPSSNANPKHKPGEPSLSTVLAKAETAQIALQTLERRSNLQYNLKQLAACIRAMHVVLAPNKAATVTDDSVVIAGATSDPTLASVAAPNYETNSANVVGAKVMLNAPNQMVHSHGALLNPIIPRARLSSKLAPPHPSIPVFEHSMQCLTEYWLNPSPNDIQPESFDLTCTLLATLTEPLQQVYRIVRQAIKLQDMHQYNASGTWNHFSPMAGMLVRVGSVEAALESALLDGPSTYSEEQLQAVLEQEARNEPLIKMPLEIRFLHEAIYLELRLGEKLKKTPKRMAEMECNDEYLLPLAKQVYAQVSAHYPAPRILKEGEYDISKSFEEQKTREAEDEAYLQDRLAGLKLSSAERNMLQNYVAPSRLETTFDDIGSLEHAKEELLSLIVPMSLPVFHSENKLIKTPLGILLYGPPGTGKTMLAKALAKTANASFIHISASTIISKWLGESEGHAAAVFSLARKISPCLIFIDEVDGLLHSRDTSEHETSRRVKNEFFSGWDGLLSNTNDPNMSVTVIAATNRPFDLDNAALRRLPHRVLVNLPDQKARLDILRKTLNGVFVAPISSPPDAKPSDITEDDRDKVIQELASLTEGYSGSDLKSVCTRAAQQHVRDFMKSQNMAEVVKSRRNSSDTSSFGTDSSDIGQNPAIAPENPFLEAARAYARRPVTMKEFNIALSEITASVNQRSGSAMELKKWHETYGSKPPGQRSGARSVSLGF
jgi:SpoVK/Ycf46/Vps4 family AAA+-type ATPase